jgi:hypothetical protein
MPGESNSRSVGAAPGCWLPLRDAVREIGSLEYLYRLARDGTLQSREDPDHGVEIWVADQDRAAGVSAHPPDPPSAAASAIPAGPQAPDLATPIGLLLAPLAESHQRSLQLARENGALSERVPALEREVEVLRESVASQSAALELAHQRIDSVLAANIALTDMLHAGGQDNQRPARRRFLWLWMLMVALSLASAAMLVSLIGSRYVLVR